MTDVRALATSMLTTSIDRWAAIARVDPSLLARQPAPGEWSAIQALQHAVDTELPVFHTRILTILGGARFPDFDPNAGGGVEHVHETAPALVARLAPMRARSLEAIDALTADDLARTGIHAVFGEVTMAQLLNQWAAHDTMHIVQAERALMQAFIPASGPWRVFFTDHDVDPPA